jgi:hypothetical protein
MKHDAPADVLDIGHIERNQFGAPKGTCEPDQQQGAIPDVFEAITHRIQHQQKVLAEQGLGLLLGAASRSFYAPQRHPDQL